MSNLMICVLGVVAGCGSTPMNNAGDAGLVDGAPDGGTTFDVVRAASISNTAMTITFDAPPDSVQATTLASYHVPSLTLAGTPTLSGNTVTITTAVQSAIAYTVTVSGVDRAADHAPLTTATADFTGRTAFDVTSATSPSAVSLTVSFDAPPDPGQAATLANYTVAGLALHGTPMLVGNTVTLATAGQTATTYTLSVAHVTRASDAEPLAIATAQVTGTPVLPPTVTNVVVASTNPDNGTVPFDTGTATVTMTGTQFDTVACPSGVALDDLDGAGAPVSTQATSCTVDSGTQITAVFPSGIRTHGATGWNVIVTNAAASNATSDVRFVPRAGVLISEVYTGTSGATDHEFVELYNPTGTTLDPSTLHLHIRSGTGTDTNKTLTAVTSATIPSLGFLMIASSASTAADPWFAHEDLTFSAALVGNGGAYVSLSATADAKVLDKVGWGTQPANGFEGTATVNLASNQSIERKPANGVGHATDSDDNSQDFNAPSTVLTPRGTADGPEPGLTFNVIGAVPTSHTGVAVTFDAPPDPAQAIAIANYAIGGLTITAAALAGNTVTLTTSGQSATAFTVTATGITRAVDGKPLTTTTATFTGTAVQIATVTNVVVTSTSPDNGTTPFDTGTSTVTITGTDFDTVTCPAGVALDDLDGAGLAVSTNATSCTIDSSTQITAVFPSGIRTNGGTGWNVIVTNSAGHNATSAVAFVPRAGLLISEVYAGTTGSTDHEYLEVYNPTATAFDPVALHLHVRSSTGVDANKTLTAVTTTPIPSHGFLLLASSVSTAADPWFTHIDLTFSAALVGDGGAYLSLSSTANAKVLDKVGFGAQPTPGFEGAAAAKITNDTSIERKPAGGAGHATDTDNNASDFNAPSITLTPLGTIDPPQP